MGSQTTIAAIRTTPVNVPLEAPYHARAGLFSGFSKTIVEVESAEGAIGIGEAPSSSLATFIDEHIAPRLIGVDPYDLAACEARCLPPIQMYQNTDASPMVMAFGGVEMALWDLMGKLENRSVASLLGGRVRDSVAFTEYFAMREPSGSHPGEQTPLEVARYCGRVAQDHGATAFEGKVGVRDLSTEVAMVREVRNAIGPDAILRLDANMAWTTTTAREALRRFEAFNLSSFEEPVRTHVELARLRSSTGVSFSTHNPNLREAVQLGVPDAFVINLTSLGGIRRTVAFIAACEEMRIDVWFYSDPGVATAAYLQVAAAVPWISHPSQTLGRWLPEDIIVGGPFIPVGGVVTVPDGPGLGVALDPQAVRRANERYRNEGTYDDYLDPVTRTRFSH